MLLTCNSNALILAKIFPVFNMEVIKMTYLLIKNHWNIRTLFNIIKYVTKIL